MAVRGGGATSERTLQVALNGEGDHPAMPRSASDIAADAARCVEAGATLLHLHAFDADGVETLAEREVGRTIEIVRAACPGVPISMTTFAQIDPDPRRRLASIAAWSILPDLVPANQGEEGIEEVSELLLGRGVGVEACVFDVDQARLMIRRGRTDRFRRVVVEPMDADPEVACAQAREIEQVLIDADVRPARVHHGMGPATWPVLRQTAQAGLGLRIGLEDTGELPDGSVASGNEALVLAAVAIRDDA